MRYLLAALAFLFCADTHAQDALVVQTCGALPQAYAIGSARQPTVDINGRLCGSTFSTLAKSGVAASHTGDTNEAILATIPVPANLLGPNGQIRINSFWTVTNSANGKTPRVRLGVTGITSAQISTLNSSWTTMATGWVNVEVLNTNATNSQNSFTTGARGTDTIVLTLSVTSTVDMTIPENVYLTGQLILGTETITLNGYSIEFIN